MTPTLIVTRPAPQGEAFAKAIAARWGGALQIILSPLLAIQPIPVATDLNDITGVIFTSANGVAAAGDLRLSQGLTAWCVGQKTAALAQSAGFDPIIGPGDAAGLVQLIIDRAPAGPLAHIRGQHSRGDVCAHLNQSSVSCVEVIAYDQAVCPLTLEAKEALKGKEPIVFPLFSPRTVAILTKEAPFGAPVYLVMMSEAVKDAAANLKSESVAVAAQPDENAMIAATLAALSAFIGRVD